MKEYDVVCKPPMATLKSCRSYWFHPTRICMKITWMEDEHQQLLLEKWENADLLKNYRNSGRIRYCRWRSVLKSYWFCLIFMQLLAIHTDDEDHRDAAMQALSFCQVSAGLHVLMAYPLPAIDASDRHDDIWNTRQVCVSNAPHSIRSYNRDIHTGCCQLISQHMGFATNFVVLSSLHLYPYSWLVTEDARHRSRHGP